MAETIRVLLVDDHDLLRDGLRRVLGMEPDIEVVGEAADGDEVIGKVRALSPDIIIIDVKMPKLNGIEATRLLKASGLGGRVIVLSLFDEYLADAIEAGVGGYLTKEVKREELVNAIRRVHQGALVLGSSLMANPKVNELMVKRLREISWGPESSGETQPSDTKRQIGGGDLSADPEDSWLTRDDWGSRPRDGTTTIMFSDIQGSATLTETLGDYRAQEVFRDHNIIVRDQVLSHGGLAVKAMGDGFMLAFFSARRAVQCAIAIQQDIAAYNERYSSQVVMVRMGLHTGETIREADDFYGRNVILAQRIADLAEGGQILVSSLLMELTQSGGDIKFTQACEVELKGLTGTHRVYRVEWKDVINLDRAVA